MKVHFALSSAVIKLKDQFYTHTTSHIGGVLRCRKLRCCEQVFHYGLSL